MKPILLFIITFIVINLGVQAQDYNFLGSFTADGTPEYLMDVPDDVDEATLTMIHNALPEGYPVPDFNPHYISSGYDTDIHLSERAEVFVTYVTEGAGYKNVLGFYTYNTNDVNVQKPTPEEITIVFPNVSELYSGGSLLPGDKVKIGDFEAGTSIGWVLLANAWKGRVTDGLWQLYSNTDYNPESDEALRSHNVLLEDPENERIILGFEDIRRDYASCDNDFNDAVFYVTATPYRAIVSSNINKVSSATDVTSANNGGLESNGTLAEKIAKRNFKRSVKQNLPNTKAKQMSILTYRTMKTSAVNKSVLQEYIPENGMFGTESSYVSSPTDLVDITNADEIYSIDYYQGEHRIAAALASYSANGVYDHTKAICDRLNNSILEDVRVVSVRGHQMIHARLLRDSGEVENTLSFSIREAEGNAYELCSYWNIDQYKEGSYYNFQVWGANNGQVFAIANKIIDKFKEKGTLVSDAQTEKIPEVFVKSGYYKNGKIHLNIINNANSKTLEFSANIKKTEQSETEQLTQIFQLTGSRLDSIVVESGYLFDVGVSVKSNTSKQMDALYLADGPWGLDYLETSAQLNQYDVIETSEQETSEGTHYVERNIHASGTIKNTLNAFRQVLAGDQSFKLNQYNAIKFKSNSTHNVELILMQSDLQDWEDRFSYVVPASKVAMSHYVSIQDFKDKNGKSASIEDVKRIVFSMNGNGKSFEPFELNIESVAFTNAAFEQENLGTALVNYQENKVSPNPFRHQTQILVDKDMMIPTISVYNMAGKLVDQQTIKTNNHTIVYQTSLPNGVYLYTIQEEGNIKTGGKFVVKN